MKIVTVFATAFFSLCALVTLPAATPSCPAMMIVKNFLQLTYPTKEQIATTQQQLLLQRNRLPDDVKTLMQSNQFLADILTGSCTAACTAACEADDKASTPVTARRRKRESPEGRHVSAASSDHTPAPAETESLRASAARKLFLYFP